MNEKPSANTNGNEAGNPGGKQERKTRTVEVRVWTSGLGTIIVTPVRGEEAREAVREADGGYDAELVESVQEYTDWTTVHFADCRGGRGRSPKLKLQVFDGDECVLKQDSLPTLDAAYLVGYAKALHEHGEVTPDNFDRYEEYNEGEPDLYQSVARAERPEDGDCNASMVREFWKKLQNGKIAEDDLFMIGLVHHIGSHLANPWQDAGAEGGGKVAFLDSVGDMGPGEIVFEIEIPENEPFDIDRLHFFCEGDWWDSGQHKALCACGYLLADCSDTSLELLEYDGRIYCRQEADDGAYWSKNRETILVHADLKDFDPEQLGEEDEDEEEKDEGDTPSQISFEGAKTFTLEQGVFKNMLCLVGYAACTDPSPLRTRIRSVLLSFKGGHLSAVATDARRLAIVERKLAFPKSHEVDLIVPLEPVKRLLKTLGDEGEVRISATSEHVAFEYGNHNVTTKLVDDNYPDFRKAIPPASGNGVTLGRETFLSTLRRVIQLVCGDSDDIDLSDFTAKLSLTANQLDILVTDSNDGEAHERMDVKYSGENVTSAFCVKYLVDPLEHLTTDEISLELLGATSPGVIRSPSGLVYILMPIRPN